MAREALAEPGDVDSLIEQGVELRERGQDDKALEQFTRAFQLSHGPPAQAQMALAEQALGHWVRAEANLVAALLAKEDPWIERHRDSLERALTTIREHIGDLELRGGVPEAQVLIDGRPVGKLPLERPIRVEAGTCVLDIKAAGYYPFSRTVTITANGTSRETVEMTARQGEEPARGGTPAPSSTKAVLPAPEPESSGARSVRRAFVWGTAIGATGFAVLGTTALVLQNGKRGDYNDDASCPGTATPRSEQPSACSDLLSSADTLRTLTWVGFLGAGALAATSVTLHLTTPEDGASVGLNLHCGPFSVVGAQCRGTF